MLTEKTKLKVMIMTDDYQIEGDIHILPGSRLTDLVNVKSRNDFMPVTSASVYKRGETTPLYEVDFLTVNRDSIVLMFPVASPVPSEL